MALTKPQQTSRVGLAVNKGLPVQKEVFLHCPLRVWGTLWCHIMMTEKRPRAEGGHDQRHVSMEGPLAPGELSPQHLHWAQARQAWDVKVQLLRGREWAQRFQKGPGEWRVRGQRHSSPRGEEKPRTKQASLPSYPTTLLCAFPRIAWAWRDPAFHASKGSGM